jgi:hypothetical protein
MKVYPRHPCLQCGKDTSNKNYCPPCLKVIKAPTWFDHKTSNGIFAELDTKKAGRRYENVTTLPSL